MSDSEELSSTKLVRRFTDQLEPASDLAIHTKQYQHDLDTEKDAREKRRLDKMYNGTQIKPQSTFSGVEIARQALQAQCEEFFATIDKKESGKKPSALRFLHRESTEQKLAREIRAGGELTIGQVTSITVQLESQWKEAHGKATTNFMNICQHLENHKLLFQWFPNENHYTSVLCGAVTMVIQASVNYSSIADKLSGYLADISDRIGVCTQWLDLCDRPSMQVRLSDIYKQFFDFFTQVASWYLKPKASRWIDSFNSNFAAGHQAAVEVIKNSIQLIREEADIESALELQGIVPHIDESLANVEERIIAQVLQARKENNEVGRAMHDLLIESAKEAAREVGRLRNQMQEQIDALRQSQIEPGIASSLEDTAAIELVTGLSRAEAEALCLSLPSTVNEIGGSDGIRLAIQTGRLAAEPRMVHALGKWTQATSGNARILWIITPWEAGMQTSEMMAALGVIGTAIQAKAQFISFVCQRPHYGKFARFKGREDQTGVLAMVYSLIQQLLQFQVPDDALHISAEMLDNLADDWDAAIGLLKLLLDNTPTLRYCIISGLNLLEGGARGMVQQTVEVLLNHVQTVDWPVRLLLTTSGQSKVLGRGIARDSKVMTDSTFHQIKGQILGPDLKIL